MFSRAAVAIVFATGFLFVSSAFATKAKLSALQGARFLTDSQLIFENPAQIHGLNNYLTFELGGTTAASDPKSEGGIFKDMFGGRGGVYLGHMSENQLLFRAQNGFLTEENPVEFFYGKGIWAASLGLSNSDKKTTDEEQRTVIARFGVDTGVMEAWANVEIIAKSDRAGDEYKGAPIATLGGEYHMNNNLYLNGSATYGKVKNQISGVTADTDILGAEIGILDRSIKNEVAAVYFGPKLRWAELKTEDRKTTVFDLPLYIGMEYNAFSWLVTRASISQNILLGSTKDESQAPPNDQEDSIDNNTTVSVGIGMNWNSIMIDATFAGSTTGELNGNTLLANLGMVYNF